MGIFSHNYTCWKRLDGDQRREHLYTIENTISIRLIFEQRGKEKQLALFGFTESVCVCRDQPGDCSKPCGYRQHSAVPADAQVLEGETPSPEETGKT